MTVRTTSFPVRTGQISLAVMAHHFKNCLIGARDAFVFDVQYWIEDMIPANRPEAAL